MRYLKHLWICLLLAPLGMAQVSNPSITIVASPPSGSCSSNLPDRQVAITGALYSCQNGTWGAVGGGGGSGTVTSVSVVTANGVSGTVATATTTPAITLSLGAITPTSVNGLSFGITGGSNYNVGGALTATSGGASTATGDGALSADTASVNETAYGYHALQLETGANQDSAFGTNALGQLLNGTGNQAFGEGALYGLTGSDISVLYNTCLGFECAVNLRNDSNYNTIAGANAASFIAGGTGNSEMNNSIIIGADVGASASNDTNEIVIGTAPTPGSVYLYGAGSNTTSIGNDLTTKFLPSGTIYLPGAPTAPTVSSNAGTGSLTHGTDNAGTIATGTASTASTLTFGVGWGTWASCTVSASTATAQPYVSAISASAVTFTYVTTGTPTLYYHCFGSLAG